MHGSGALDAKQEEISYNSVINCWAQSGCKDAPDAAQKLLLRMKQHYLGGDEYLRPTSITYNMASSAFT
jgi:hypothetical protein